MAEVVQASGLVNLYFGRRGRALLSLMGLVDVEDETTTWISRGGEPGAQFQRMNHRMIVDLLRPAAVVSQSDAAFVGELYRDPSFAFVHLGMVGAWGRKAPPVS